MENNQYQVGEPVIEYNPNVSSPLGSETEKQQQDKAFYTAGLTNPNEMEAVFNEVNTEYATLGYSNLVKQVENELKTEQDQNNKTVLESLIKDPDVDMDAKRATLQQYIYGYTPNKEIKDKYLDTLSTMDLENRPEGDMLPVQMKLDKAFIANKAVEIRETLKVQAEAIKNNNPILPSGDSHPSKVLKALGDLPEGFMKVLDMSDDELEADDGFFYSVGVNTMQVLDALFVQLAPYIGELGTTGVAVPLTTYDTGNETLNKISDTWGDLYLTDIEKVKTLKNFKEVREYIQKLYNEEPEKFLGVFNNYKDVGIVGDTLLNVRDAMKTVFRLGGIIDPEEYDKYITQDSVIMTAFEYLDKGFTWGGKQLTPDDPAKGKTYLEIASFFAYLGAKKGRALAIRTKNRYEMNKAGYDTSVSKFFEELDRSEPAPIKQEAARIIDSKVLDNHIEVTTPYINTAIANKKVADSLLLEAVNDASGGTAKILQVPRTKLIDLALAPAINLLQRPQHIDMNEFLLNKKIYEFMGDSYFNNQGFLFSDKRRSWISDVDNVLDSATSGIELYQRNSDSIFLNTEGNLKANIVFSKTPDTYFTTVDNAITAVEVIRAKIKQSGLEKFEIIIEHLDDLGIKKDFKSIKELQAYALFKTASDSPLNITNKLNDLRAQQKITRGIVLSKKKLEMEALVNDTSVANLKKVLENRLNLREVEITTLVKELGIAEKLEGKKTLTPKLQIRVKRESEFFSVDQAVTDGFNKPTKRTNFITRALFSNDITRGLVMFGSINKKLTEHMHSHGLRSQAWLKETLGDVQKQIAALNNVQRADIDKIYKISMTDPAYNLNVYSISDIKGFLRNNLTTKDAQIYQRLLIDTRHLNAFLYDAVNMFEVQRLEGLGYKESFKYKNIDPETGTITMENVIAKDTFALTLETNPPVLFDFANNKGVANVWRDVNANTATRRFFEAMPDKSFRDTGLKIYHLGYKHTYEGKIYEYGIFRDQKPGAMPQKVIKSKTNHMPAIMTGSKFVRKYPLELTINGINYPFKAEFKRGFTSTEYVNFINQRGAYKRAAMMAPTGLVAQRWLTGEGKQYNKQYNYWYDNENIYRIEDAVENNPIDRIEANTLRENAMAASKHRSTENIAHAEYQDSFVSFVMATESNGARAVMQPVINEFKLRWLNEYVGTDKKINIKYTDKSNESAAIGGANRVTAEFPILESQIEAAIKGDRLSSKVAEQALLEWRQIQVLDEGYGVNFIGRKISSAAGWIAEYADKPITGRLSIMESAVQKAVAASYKLAARPSILQNTPMRTTSVLKIQWQIPMWHWLIQTANSWGHLGIASTAGGINASTLNRFFKTASQSSLIVADMLLKTKNLSKGRDSIIAGIDWMQENATITKSGDALLNISAKDRALIIRNGLDSGLFHITDHTFAKNFWSVGPKKLIDGKGKRRTFDSASEMLGRIGFEQGELMGRVNTWMAVRLDWQAKNPGLNWRNPAALQEITAGARKLAGSMDTYGEMGLSRVPVIATFHQFAAFIYKSSEAMWNTDATPFTPKQMAGLTAFNFGMYGIRGGMWYGSAELIRAVFNQVMDPAEVDIVMNDIDDISLLNFMINATSDAMLPTYDKEGNLLKSDLEFNMRFSPMGADMPFGGLGAVYEFIMKDGENGLQKFGAAGRTMNDIFGDDGVIDMFQAIWSPIHTDRPFDAKVKGSLRVASKLSGFSSGLLRYYMAMSVNDKMSKEGQMAGESITEAERWLWGWSSVQSKEERKKFEYFAQNKNRTDNMKDLAKDTYRSIVAMYGEAPNVYELAEVARVLKAHLSGSDYLSEAKYAEFWDELLVYQDRSEGTARENLFQKAVRDYKMEARTDNESLAIITKLVGIFESRGPGDPQYESLEHIRLMMINGRNVNKEKAILDQRKKLKSEGKIY